MLSVKNQKRKTNTKICEVVICRQYTKVGKHALHGHFEYAIIGISDKSIKLKDDAAVKRNGKNRQRGRNVDDLPEEFDMPKM